MYLIIVFIIVLKIIKMAEIIVMTMVTKSVR